VAKALLDGDRGPDDRCV